MKMNIGNKSRFLSFLCWASLVLVAVTPTTFSLAEKPRSTPTGILESEYLVELTSSANVAAVAAATSMEIVGQSQVQPSWYFMRPLTEQDRSETLATLQGTPGVIHASAGAGALK